MYPIITIYYGRTQIGFFPMVDIAIRKSRTNFWLENDITETP